MLVPVALNQWREGLLNALRTSGVAAFLRVHWNVYTLYWYTSTWGFKYLYRYNNIMIYTSIRAYKCVTVLLLNTVSFSNKSKSLSAPHGRLFARFGISVIPQPIVEKPGPQHCEVHLAILKFLSTGGCWKKLLKYLIPIS